MYIDDEELRGLYKTSSEEHIQAIESALMELEKQPENLAPLHDLLRSAHTLKGDSRMLGVGDVETLVHQIEECLMPIEKGQASLTSALCDRLYTGLDTIKKLAHTAITGEANDVNMFYVLSSLMGDGEASPQLSATPTVKVLAIESSEESDLFELDPILPDRDAFTADRSLFAEASPMDLAIEGGEDLFPPANPARSAAPTSLQTDFLDLAAQLFPTDSTLPVLDRGAVFNDFELLPGTTDLSGIEAGEFPFSEDFAMFDSGDLSQALEPFDLTQDDTSIDSLATLFEDELFPTLDGTLMPTLDDTLVPEVVTAAPENRFSTGAATPTNQSIEPIVAVTPIATPAAPPAQITSKDSQAETIRVAANQLDVLMGQAGEINVIDQQIASRLTDLEALFELWDTGSRDYQSIQPLLAELPARSPLHKHLSHAEQQWAEMGALIGKFKQLITGDSSRLNLVTSALESGVKKLRLLPLSTVFNLFPRMVRDLAKTQSKEINFAIEGGDLLLDKRLLEDIKDPLMHILRNAIDHGIETAAERQQHGKLAAATLLIQVRQTGNQTTIEIADDGRGLDVQKIKATAIKRGIHTEAELGAMTTAQIQSLIFAAGFSTRTRVTELSGRGVGLDIVRTNVERLKGSVEVESLPNQGCTFRINLSHTIGSSSVMMVDVRDRIYAIPVEFVDRMLLLDKAEIFALGGTPTTKIAGNTMTVAWLADLLALPAVVPASPSAVTRTTNSVACLLLQSGRQQLALLVDRIRDQQLVTIESPHPLLKNVPHLSGSTILGTGEVCLVLNPIDLFATAAGGTPLAPANIPAAAPIPVDRPPSLLLVEDSIVIRTQMQRILGGAGYQVTPANDGLEGWEKLQAGDFDLVVSDVEMPRWSGLELTTEIRKHPEYQDLPVVLVTTLARSDDRDRGLQAGANAYLTKGDFDQQLLLDTLTDLI
jgi:two-component system, chemotaxis family, sensor kinase CheA